MQKILFHQEIILARIKIICKKDKKIKVSVKKVEINRSMAGDCQSPSQLPNQNFKQRLVDWDNAVNAVYKGPVNDHGKDFRKVFPLLSSPIANKILKSQSRTITPDWSSCSTPIAGLNNLQTSVTQWGSGKHTCVTVL